MLYYSATQGISRREGRKGNMVHNDRNTLAPVVQRLDSFFCWINHYPVDKMYWLEYILSAG